MNQTAAAPETSYDRFIAKLVANAVKEIEKETGRKVHSIKFPPPWAAKTPNDPRSINVVFES